MRTHWSTLVLVHNDAGVIYDEAERMRCLRELKASGTMSEAYLTRTWLRHELPTDRRTWGPNRREIDWAGFDAEAAPTGGAPATPASSVASTGR
jgi:hypothetical protein